MVSGQTNEPVSGRIVCQECGALTGPGEYHPFAFCVLIKAGLDPVTVVREAACELHKDEQVSR